MSLVLSRKKHETILIAGPCTVEIRKIEGKRVTLVVHADRQVSVLRGELVEPEKSEAA